VDVLPSRLDPTSEEHRSNRAAMLERIAEVEALRAQARAGGGERAVQRHRDRGKLTVRERIELLLDRHGYFLELSPLAANGTDFTVGASVVTGIGTVSGVETVIIGNDPTVRGGSINPYSARKTLRAMEIAAENRLPLVQLTESGGGDLQTQAEVFVEGGRTFRDLALLSKAGVPTISVVFGNATAGGAYVPGLSDYTVLIKQQSKVFLGGPPLVKMATGEDADDEELGGAEMHTATSGLGDYLALDEPDALRTARGIVEHLRWRKLGPGPTLPADDPVHDPGDLLGLPSLDGRRAFDVREILARVLDGSRFEEFKPRYGTSLVTGWGSLHGFELAVIANNGVLFNEESEKAAQFIALCNQRSTPILFVQNTTGYIVGTRYEQRGITKDGSKMVRAVSTSQVPHLTLIVGASFGAGNYGMSGRAYRPRLLLAWPNQRIGIMGPKQMAGVLSIVARNAAQARGLPFDEEKDAALRAHVEGQLERESHALFATARLWDDGLVDPRETRTALGIALSAVHSNVVRGSTDMGPVRM
jgi:acetyl-CoA carboxylase carboxyltransferase component